MKKSFAINLKNTVYGTVSIFKILFTCTRMKLELLNYSTSLRVTIQYQTYALC